MLRKAINLKCRREYNLLDDAVFCVCLQSRPYVGFFDLSRSDGGLHI